MNDFLKLRDKMQEKYGASSVMLVSDVPVRPPLPSASLALDFAMGGGLPPDRVVEVAGQEGTGKSSFGLLSMANFLDAQPDRGAVILDLEHKLTASWVEQLIGKDRMERVILAWPDHVEQATDMYTQAVSTGGISFVLVDSIGGAPSQRVTEKSAEIGNIGGNALSVTRFAQLASIHSQKYACFSGDTPILTGSGVRPIRELSGEVHRVVDGCGNWVDAKFSGYGEQKLYKITLQRNGRRRELWATAEHRWFVHATKKPNFINFKSSKLDWDTVDKIRSDYSSGLAQKDIADKYGLSRACVCNIVNGKVWTEERRNSPLGVAKSVSEVTTSLLSPGQTLKSGYARNLVRKTFPSQFGIAHGFVFGDGTRNSKGSSVVLWGEKDSSLLPYFTASRNCPTVNNNGTEGISFWGLPGFFKDLPSLTESTSYLYGWLSGFFAADGSVSIAGQCVITQVDRNAIDHFQLICNVLGIHTYDVSKYSGWKKDPRGELRFGETYRLEIDPYSLTDEFFIIPDHHSRWRKRIDEMPNRRQEDWKVVLVEETDRTEEVYCASVDSTQSFVLDGNILTGNCLTMGINQTRDDMAGYNRLVTPGGKGWKHACVLRIQLKRGQGKIDEKVNGEVMQVGYEIVAKVVKNQLAPQGRTANYWFMAVPTEKWGFGIDRLEEIVRIGLLTSVIRQSGAYYYEDGLPDGKIKSKEALSHYVRDNPDYYSYLSRTVMDLVTKDGEMANLVAPMGEGDEDGSE